MNARTRTTLIATALVLGIAAGPATAAAPAADRTTTASHQDGTGSVDTAALKAAIANAGRPGADTTAALVRVGGTEGTWRGSAGVHDIETNRPADPGARFRAGSVTKVFTAAVVLQLAGEGRVDLNKPVRAYLPELIPAAYDQVTVRQLLNHTSGIPSVGSGGDTLDYWYAHRLESRDPADVVREATAQKPDFAPGTKQHYDNIGYTVAGLLIERVTGDSYAHQLSRRILRPLHLNDTSVTGTATTIRGRHNHGYQVFTKPDGTTELVDVSVWGEGDTFAAGDLISTTADLERFTRALFTGHVVRGPLLKEMFTLPDASVRDAKTGKRAAYSAGLTTMRLGGRDVWGKTGGRWGYTTLIGGALSPTGELSRTLVYSLNSTDAKGTDMNRTAQRLMLAAFGTPDAS
ncbi:serine hydrolase [Streptomyces sp. CBMA152]|uniref:serine hydrolase domain-containing protein n=1 Tax=Streptomyces sp. CBMA152 TaxID=1896312 RepID=UPI0016607712|nr:serine hydrolase domain-containing protein [Streptomyces sp. CBMA152]MBD0744491.1 peptidase [Streptomyces sp. CBMA152]